jgi:hypothetical protein
VHFRHRRQAGTSGSFAARPHYKLGYAFRSPVLYPRIHSGTALSVVETDLLPLTFGSHQYMLRINLS